MRQQLWLSASQIVMFLRCARQWAFRYIEGLKVPPSGAMKQGNVFHRMAEKNYAQKMGSRVDMSEGDLADYFAEEFETSWASEEVKLNENETKGGFKDEGVALTRVFRAGIAPKVQPIAVERNFKIVVGKDDAQVLLNGYIDVIDEQGRIRDTKALTPQRVPNEFDLSRDLQLSTYALARKLEDVGSLPTETTPARLMLDVAVKLKHPEARILPTARSIEGLRLHLNTVGNVAKAIKADAFPRNPTGWWCSPKWCGYWDRCMGKGLVTLDLAENLETQLKESLDRGEEKEGPEKGRKESGKGAAEAGQKGREEAVQAATGSGRKPWSVRRGDGS